MFYYIKKRYPKLVDHIVGTEAGGLKTNIEGSNASLTVNLNKSINALEELSETRDSASLSSYVHPDTREGPRNIEDDKSQSVVTGEQLEAMKSMKSSGQLKDKTIDSIMSNLVDHEVGENEQSRFESMNIDLDDDNSISNNTTTLQNNVQKFEKDSSSNSETEGHKLSKFVGNVTNNNNEGGGPSDTASKTDSIQVSNNHSSSKFSSNEDTDLSSTNDKQSFVNSGEEFSNQNVDSNNPMVDTKSLLKDVEDLQKTISKEDGIDNGLKNSIKPQTSSDVSNDCEQVGCLTKELLNLFGETFVDPTATQSENINEYSKVENSETESFLNNPTQQNLQREVTPHLEENKNVNLMKELNTESETVKNLGEAPQINDKKLNLQNKANSNDSQTADVNDASVAPNSQGMSKEQENSNFHQNDKQQSNHSPSNLNKDYVEVFPGFFRHKHPQEETGQTRKGGDPYSSIGHNSLRHDHDESSVVANKYYDKSIGKFTIKYLISLLKQKNMDNCSDEKIRQKSRQF